MSQFYKHLKTAHILEDGKTEHQIKEEVESSQIVIVQEGITQSK